ncbi:MAG: DUF4435 domain-containing protein [Dehalococcoidia bacterium]|nr:DUF4435 domain-containing protein [Dehalococcoidia bacterium]
MNSDERYTPQEYIRYLEVDDTQKHILVEGKSDKRVFDLLLRNFCKASDREMVFIDTAEKFIKSHPENREIVEEVCSQIGDKPCADRFSAFVDREFRDFDLDHLADSVGDHRVSGRLVWSRGHSIENYFFDFDFLGDFLPIFARDEFDSPLEIFGEVFDYTLRVACAIGLASKEKQVLKKVRMTLRDGFLKISDSPDNEPKLEIDHLAWKNSLERRHLSPDDANELIANFDLWLKRIKGADPVVVRWLCDGHIGYCLLWEVYDCCVRHCGCREGIHKIEESALFNIYAHSWVKNVLFLRNGECPLQVFQLIGLTINN